MSNLGDTDPLPWGWGLTRGNWLAFPSLYGYAFAVWIAAGSAPVGVGPGKPTFDSGGNGSGLTAAGGRLDLHLNLD